MKKELFVKCIEQLKAHQEKSDKICTLLDSLSEERNCFYPFSDDDALIFDILIDYYSESIVENDISYFCYDLEFGKCWSPGTITQDDKDIKMETIDDLYEVCEKALKA